MKVQLMGSEILGGARWGRPKSFSYGAMPKDTSVKNEEGWEDRGGRVRFVRILVRILVGMVVKLVVVVVPFGVVVF